MELWREKGPRFEAHTAIVMANLAEALCGEGRWNEGAQMLSTALEMSRRALGAGHINTVADMSLLASAEMVVGELDRAIALFREALAIERAAVSRQHATGSYPFGNFQLSRAQQPDGRSSCRRLKRD